MLFKANTHALKRKRVSQRKREYVNVAVLTAVAAASWRPFALNMSRGARGVRIFN